MRTELNSNWRHWIAKRPISDTGQVNYSFRSSNRTEVTPSQAVSPAGIRYSAAVNFRKLRDGWYFAGETALSSAEAMAADL